MKAKSVFFFLAVISWSNLAMAQIRSKQNSILVYYKEEYGSQCCPRDPIYSRPDLNSFITSFEKKNDIKITHSYFLNRGKEGERTVYLTLDGLTAKQRAGFVNQRLMQLKFDTKASNKNPTPFKINKNGLLNLIE